MCVYSFNHIAFCSNSVYKLSFLQLFLLCFVLILYLCKFQWHSFTLEICFSASAKKKTTPSKRAIHAQKLAQYRSTIMGTANLLKEFKFRVEHITSLRKTSFWHIINALIDNRVNSTRKFDIVTKRLIGYYDRPANEFIIGTQNLILHPSNIQLIFGIESGRWEN